MLGLRLASLHNLSFFIQLLTKLGKLKKLLIIAIPTNYNKELARQEIEKIIKDLTFTK